MIFKSSISPLNLLETFSNKTFVAQKWPLNLFHGNKVNIHIIVHCTVVLSIHNTYEQGCGSGSDPDSMTFPDPDPGAWK
jgi:hypothetical protein